MLSQLAIERGAEVESGGKRYMITHVIDGQQVLAQDKATGKPATLKIQDLCAPTSDTADRSPIVPDLSQIDGLDWDEARRRLQAIRPFLDDRRHARSEVAERAAEYRTSTASLYRWIAAYRASDKLSVLLPTKKDGGRGKPRLSPEVDAIVGATIEEHFLTRQQPSVIDTAREVARRCRNARLPVPHTNTIRARIRAIPAAMRLKRRAHGKLAQDRLTPRPGTFDEAQQPLSIVQIDHTELDIILVDEHERLSIGKPWITLAFDVYTRMVVGYYISLDPPNAFSTGMCLTHAILPKETWLAARGIPEKWECWGKPTALHLDNAREFRGEVLKRACEQYGIAHNFRPVKTPHYGAHIERMLGTLLSKLHTLPGTTFSNPTKRGDYKSDARAAMTLSELDTWVATYLTGVYHKTVHSALKMSPNAKWERAIFGDGKTEKGVGLKPRVVDPEEVLRLRLDFMPFYERTVQPKGVVVDYIYYYSDVLRPYISAVERRQKQKFIFRQDPRDISVLYFWDPELKQYSEIPYRDTSHPPMSVWELRAMLKRLEDDGRANYDEHQIFEAYDRLREQQEQAVTTTKRVRRERARRDATARTPPLRLVKSTTSHSEARDHADEVPAHITPFEIEDL